jgi:hypothetical protein
MGFFDRLRDGLGVQRPLDPAPAADPAIARYRYLLQTAPPETIEQAHAEAFAQLTPAQRQRVLQELAAAVPAGGERAAVLRAGDEPQGLARMATRAEMRQPGVLERMFGGAGPAAGFGAAPGMGGMLAGTLLSSMAGTVLGSVIAQQFFHAHPGGAGILGDATPAHDAPSFWRDGDASATPHDSGFTQAVDDGGDLGDPNGDFDFDDGGGIDV